VLKRKGSPRKERTTPLGKYLTEKREEQGKTQQQIATEIKKTRSCICKIERGTSTEKSLRGLILYDLAKAYGASIAEILRKAKWTQLPLLDITEDEMKELLQHLKQMRKNKRQQERQPKE